MWELLNQLRIVLPYLTRLVPLLDKGLLHAPDLTELRGDIKQTQLAGRDAADRLGQIDARIEAQSVILRETAEANQKQLKQLASSIRSLQRLMTGILALLLLALAILVALLVLHLR